MYLCSDKKSFYVHGPIGPRMWTIGFTYIVRTVHVRGTKTWNRQNILVEPCLHVKVTSVCTNTRGINWVTILLTNKKQVTLWQQIMTFGERKGRRRSTASVSPNCIQRNHWQQTVISWNSRSLFLHRGRFGRYHGSFSREGILLFKWGVSCETGRNRIFLL